MAQPTYDLIEFQFEDDDGNEAGSTLLGSINDPLDMLTGTDNVKRIRLQMFNDNSKVGTETFNWEYNNTTQVTDWQPINAVDSQHIRAYDTTNLADGDDCTNRLTDRETAVLWVSNNNGVCEDGAGTSYSHTADFYSEQLLAFYIVDGDVNDGDAIEIRVVEVSTDTITYLNTPNLTVDKPAGARRIFITHV